MILITSCTIQTIERNEKSQIFQKVIDMILHKPQTPYEYSSKR